VSPTRAEHVATDLRGERLLILDGGPTAHGIESTVIDATGEAIRILRPGAVTRETIEAVLGETVSSDAGMTEAGTAERPTSPGQLASHYAPRARLRLDVTEVRDGEALLAFGVPLAC